MGTWGEEPFENDGAMDWLVAHGKIGLRDMPLGAVRKGLSHNREEIRYAAVGLVCSQPRLWANKTLRAKALRTVEALQCNEEWLSSWVNLGAITAELTRTKRKLFDNMELLVHVGENK